MNKLNKLLTLTGIVLLLVLTGTVQIRAVELESGIVLTELDRVQIWNSITDRADDVISIENTCEKVEYRMFNTFKWIIDTYGDELSQLSQWEETMTGMIVVLDSYEQVEGNMETVLESVRDLVEIMVCWRKA